MSFGLGLQTMNIVKDVAADLERGRCFLPRALAAEQSVPPERLLDPARDAALAVVRAVCARARHHFFPAHEYTSLWPVARPKDVREPAIAVRQFCAVSLALGFATLREVESGRDTLLPGATPKVSRALVASFLAEARLAATANDRLARHLARPLGGSRTQGAAGAVDGAA
jgi:farnesyl-diphosphate farnesyltransferase